MASKKDKLLEQFGTPEQPVSQRRAPYPVGIAAMAPPLQPEITGLPENLQDIARRYVDARRRSGEALLEAARWLTEARQIAEHGEWHTFLEATGTPQDTAERLLNIHQLALQDQRFADAIRGNWLSQTAAALLAQPSTPETVREDVLAAETPPSTREVQARIREAKQASNSRNVAGVDHEAEQDSKFRSAAEFDHADVDESSRVLNAAPSGSAEQETPGLMILREVSLAFADLADKPQDLSDTATALRLLDAIDTASARLRRMLLGTAETSDTWQ